MCERTLAEIATVSVIEPVIFGWNYYYAAIYNSTTP